MNRQDACPTDFARSKGPPWNAIREALRSVKPCRGAGNAMYNKLMKFEWDDHKNQNNLIKHGISFEEAKDVFDDPNLLTFEDNRFPYGETRLISVGKIFLTTQKKMVIVVVVHTPRGQSMRLISARKANERERKRYGQTP